MLATGDDADIAAFSDRPSDETLTVVRGNTAVIKCPAPPSIPAPPLIRYLQDGRPLRPTRMLL